ncbi:hypothetical protein BC831DRAFT_516011 [Entophlyctis helioformis]|nr:hypothetical protein BC831DRAFT_516011 [Entophlyctis helioformis]
MSDEASADPLSSNFDNFDSNEANNEANNSNSMSLMSADHDGLADHLADHLADQLAAAAAAAAAAAVLPALPTLPALPPGVRRVAFTEPLVTLVIAAVEWPDEPDPPRSHPPGFLRQGRRLSATRPPASASSSASSGIRRLVLSLFGHQHDQPHHNNQPHGQHGHADHADQAAHASLDARHKQMHNMHGVGSEELLMSPTNSIETPLSASECERLSTAADAGVDADRGAAAHNHNHNSHNNHNHGNHGHSSSLPLSPPSAAVPIPPRPGFLVVESSTPPPSPSPAFVSMGAGSTPARGGSAAEVSPTDELPPAATALTAVHGFVVPVPDTSVTADDDDDAAADTLEIVAIDVRASTATLTSEPIAVPLGAQPDTGLGSSTGSVDKHRGGFGFWARMGSLFLPGSAPGGDDHHRAGISRPRSRDRRHSDAGLLLPSTLASSSSSSSASSSDTGLPQQQQPPPARDVHRILRRPMSWADSLHSSTSSSPSPPSSADGSATGSRRGSLSVAFSGIGIRRDSLSSSSSASASASSPSPRPLDLVRVYSEPSHINSGRAAGSPGRKWAWFNRHGHGGKSSLYKSISHTSLTAASDASAAASVRASTATVSMDGGDQGAPKCDGAAGVHGDLVKSDTVTTLRSSDVETSGGNGRLDRLSISVSPVKTAVAAKIWSAANTNTSNTSNTSNTRNASNGKRDLSPTRIGGHPSTHPQAHARLSSSDALETTNCDDNDADEAGRLPLGLHVVV